MYRIFNGKSNLQCCPDGHLTLNGSFDRRIRTSSGEFKMAFWRVRCSKCGKSFAPLASSSAWSITKPKLTSLKSWLSKLPVVQIIAEQLITWSELEKAERAIDKLIGYFDGCGYSTAATYIRRAKYGMFGYIRRWLKWELISSRSSSMVGIVMRKPGRRFSLTACGWSDKGVTKIARIILNDLQMPENGWIAG